MCTFQQLITKRTGGGSPGQAPQCAGLFRFVFNTQYGCYSTIVFTLKMEFLTKNTIVGLKMMVKSGLGKIFFKFPHAGHAGNYFSLLHKSAQNHKFSNKNNHLPAWRDFKINFSRPLFTIIFKTKIVFLG